MASQHIILKQSTEQMMLDDFLLELGDLDKLSSGVGGIEFISKRKSVILASIDELKKQIKDSQRHGMLLEGINPDEQ